MITLTKELVKKITKHSLKEFPNEACGLLAGRDGIVEKVYEMINTDKSPASYFMDAAQQLKVMKEIRSLDLEMIGIYHSHVASRAFPSAHDVKLAFYPEASCVIVSLQDRKNPEIKSFKIIEGKIISEEVKIVSDKPKNQRRRSWQS